MCVCKFKWIWEARGGDLGCHSLDIVHSVSVFLSVWAWNSRRLGCLASKPQESSGPGLPSPEITTVWHCQKLTALCSQDPIVLSPVPHSVWWAAVGLAWVEIVRLTHEHRLTSVSVYNQDRTWTPLLLFPPPMCWDARHAPAHPAKQFFTFVVFSVYMCSK